jgi:hypothetical protein
MIVAEERRRRLRRGVVPVKESPLPWVEAKGPVKEVLM